MLDIANLISFNVADMIRITKEQVVLLCLAGTAGVSIAVPASLVIYKLMMRITELYKSSKLPAYLATIKSMWSRSSDDLPLAVRRALAIEQNEKLPDWMENWLAQVNKRVKKAGISIPIGRYVFGMLLGAVIGVTVGIMVLKNPTAAVILGIAAFLVPDAVLVGYMQKRRAKMIEQLGVAVRVFSAEYNDTPQVARALSNTAKRIPAPLGDVLVSASRKIAAGQDKDKVFGEMMAKLDFDYGRMFVQLLRMAWDDTSVKPMFSKLATRIASLQSLIQKNHSNMAYSRLLAMGVNALILPAFIVTGMVIPGASEFMIENSIGRLLVTMCFLSVLTGLVMDRILNGVNL